MSQWGSFHLTSEKLLNFKLNRIAQKEAEMEEKEALAEKYKEEREDTESRLTVVADFHELDQGQAKSKRWTKRRTECCFVLCVGFFFWGGGGG